MLDFSCLSCAKKRRTKKRTSDSTHTHESKWHLTGQGGGGGGDLEKESGADGAPLNCKPSQMKNSPKGSVEWQKLAPWPAQNYNKKHKIGRGKGGSRDYK